MSSGYTPAGRVNRYWKRPKPRIYECNIRDAERFYKDSYSSYVQAKQLTSAYRHNDIEDEFATKWTMSRIGANVDSSPYLDPLRREASASLSSDYRSFEDPAQRSSHASMYSRHEDFQEQDRDRPSMRAKSLIQTRTDEENGEDLRDVEQRLERIKKLKEELGMKSGGPSDAYDNSSSRSILKKSSRHSPSENSSQTNYAQSSYSSARAGSRSRGEPDDYENRYASKSEKTTRFSSKYGSDEDRYGDQNGKPYSKYTTDESSYSASKSSRQNNSKYGDDLADSYSASKSTRRANKYLDDDDDNCYSTGRSCRKAYKGLEDEASSYSSGRPSSKENKYSADDDSYSYSSKKTARQNSALNADKTDDDEIVSNLRKKFPTSEEILERIKNMDADL